MNTRWRQQRVALVIAGFTLWLCAGAAHAQARLPKRGTWTEVFRLEEIGGAELMRPQTIRVSGNVIAVFDFGNSELTAIDASGRFLWRQGRPGGGPGEYSNVTDVAANGHDGFLVLDNGTSRITRISGTGKLIGTLPVKTHAMRIARQGSRIILKPSSDRFVEILGDRGESIRSVGIPAGLVTNTSPLLRDNVLLPTRGGEIVVVHRWSTAVVVLDSLGNLRRRFDLLNKQGFPALMSYKAGEKGEFTVTKIDPKAREILGCSAVAEGRLLMVDQRADTARAVLDEYDLSTGRYLGSSRLPAFPVDMVSTANLLIAVVEEPVPAIVAWRWKGG
jgi:outer membrane protein assembly factor BamB